MNGFDRVELQFVSSKLRTNPLQSAVLLVCPKKIRTLFKVHPTRTYVRAQERTNVVKMTLPPSPLNVAVAAAAAAPKAFNYDSNG